MSDCGSRLSVVGTSRLRHAPEGPISIASADLPLGMTSGPSRIDTKACANTSDAGPSDATVSPACAQPSSTARTTGSGAAAAHSAAASFPSGTITPSVTSGEPFLRNSLSASRATQPGTALPLSGGAGVTLLSWSTSRSKTIRARDTGRSASPASRAMTSARSSTVA